MDTKERLVEEKEVREELSKAKKCIHRILPKIHMLSNGEMKELDGGRGGSRRNAKVGTYTFTGCP